MKEKFKEITKKVGAIINTICRFIFATMFGAATAYGIFEFLNIEDDTIIERLIIFGSAFIVYHTMWNLISNVNNKDTKES